MSAAARAASSVCTGLSSTTRRISRTTAADRASRSHRVGVLQARPGAVPVETMPDAAGSARRAAAAERRRTAFDSKVSSIVVLRPPCTTATSQTARWSTRPGRSGPPSAGRG